MVESTPTSVAVPVIIKVLTPVHLCLDMQRLFGPDSAFVPCAASRHTDAGILFETTSKLLLGTEKIRYSFLVILLQCWSSALTDESITNALVARLRTTSALDDHDVQAVRSLPVVVKHYQPGQAIVRDGDRPAECCLISKGFCVRSKMTSNGRRQILSIHIPGEIPDLQSLHLNVLDHDLIALTECTLGFISHVFLREITRRRPNVAEIFWRDTLIDAAMFRDWIVNVGQRPAPSRLAHIVVELRERLKVIGQVQGARFEMPLTQEQIGEAMGITPVHANRIVKQLRDDNVLEFHRGSVRVIDEQKLLKLADFDGLYLHQRPSL